MNALSFRYSEFFFPIHYVSVRRIAISDSLVVKLWIGQMREAPAMFK
jgi:hypothetical protein